MSLLLEALKKAERDKLGEKEQFAPVKSNVVGKEDTVKLFSEHTSGETLEFVPENKITSSDIPKKNIETKSSQNNITSQNIFLSKKDNVSRISIGRSGKWMIILGILLIIMIGGAYYVWQEITYTSNIAPQSDEFQLDIIRQEKELPLVSSENGIITLPEPNNFIKETSALTESNDLGGISSVSRSNKKIDGEKISEPHSRKELVKSRSVDAAQSMSSNIIETSTELSVKKVQEAKQDSVDSNLFSSKNPIEITRNPTRSAVSEELKTAYQAYINGDLEIARQYYLKELKISPRNKDVLLGLAAVATRLQQINEAQAYYLRILELDPRDSSAIAGMAGLIQADPNQTESKLKNLLVQQPNAAALHFALGNNYVSQLRWTEAQQSFFRALSINATNADYAFNLAVSLDHLKKKKLAEKYYREALVLAGKGPVGFKEEQITKRLNELIRQ